MSGRPPMRPDGARPRSARRYGSANCHTSKWGAASGFVWKTSATSLNRTLFPLSNSNQRASMPTRRKSTLHAPENAQGLPDEVVDGAMGRGWRFFPVERQGKRPLINSWQSEATSDISKLRGWSTQFPHCNWGWAIPHDHMVLDADGSEGKLAIESLAGTGLMLPTTLTISTGDGEHFVFSSTTAVKNSVGRIAPKLDVRAHTGFVVYAG